MKKLSLIVGILLLGMVGYISFENLQLMMGKTQMGTVVSYSNDGYPIVEFEVDSSTYQIQSTTSVQIDDQNTLGVGTPMEVIYVQDNPEGAKIYTFGGFWSEAIGLLVLGLLFVGNYWWWWRKQRKIQK